MLPGSARPAVYLHVSDRQTSTHLATDTSLWVYVKDTVDSKLFDCLVEWQQNMSSDTVY